MTIKFDEFINFGDFNNEAKKTETSINSLDDSIQELTQTLMEFMKANEQASKTGLKDLQVQLQKTETTTEKGQQAIEGYTKSIDQLGKELQENQQAQKNVQNVVKNTSGSINELRENLKRQVKEWNNLSREERENTQIGGRLAASIRRTRTEVNDLNAATRRTNTAFSAAKGSYNALTQENKRLAQQLRQIPLELLKTDKAAQQLQRRFRQNTETLKAFDASLGQNFRNVGNYQNAIQGAASQIVGFGLGISGVIEISRRFIQNTAEISDALADVRKTTDLTQPSVEALFEQLKGLDTRTSIQGLLEISQAAGRLSIGKELVEAGDLDGAVQEILAFTESVDKVFVALGDDLEGSADEIATTLGKIAGVLGLEAEFGVAEGLERIGSAVNELAANTRATATPIIDITKRLQGIASTTDVAASDIIGLAATLDILGQRSESSSTAVTTLFLNIGEDLPKFAKVAGLSLQEFSDIVREDSNEAFLRVLEGAKSSEEGFLALSDTLVKLGIDSKRAGGILTALAQNTNTLRDAQDLASQAIADNTSVIDEFDIKNETLGASIEKLEKAFNNLLTGTGELAGGLKTVVDVITLIVEAIGELEIEELIGGFGILNKITNTFVDSLLEFLGVGEEAREIINNILEVVQTVTNPIKLLSAGWRELTGAVEETAEAGESIDLFGGKVLDTLDKVNAEIKMYTERIENAAETGEQGLIPFFRSQIVQLQKLQGELSKAAEDTKNLGSANVQQKTTLADLTEELKNLREARQNIDIEDKEALARNLAQIQVLEKRIKVLNGNVEANKKAEDSLKKLNEARAKALAQFEMEDFFYGLAEERQRQLADSVDEIAKKYGFLTDEILTTNEALAAQERSYKDTADAVLALSKAFDIQEEQTGEQTEKDIADQKKRLEFRQEVETAIVDASFNALEQVSQLREVDFSRQFENLQAAEEAQLSLVGDNEEEQLRIRAEFDQKRRDLERQQAQANKTQALFQVGIDTALAITKTIANLGLPAAIPFTIAAAAQGAVQAAIIAATPIPQFAEGVIGLQGPGTETSDSIPAMLSMGESVMTGKETRDFNPTLWAIRKGAVSPDVLNRVAIGDDLPDIMRKGYVSGYESLLNVNNPEITASDIQQMIEVKLNSKGLIKGIGQEVAKSMRHQKRPINNIKVEREPRWK